MKLKMHVLAAVTATLACVGAHAADNTADPTKLTRDEAKQLKAQSEGDYKARGHVAEANEALNKADCEALSGDAKSACKKDAKAAAKSDKAHAKAIHESEEDAIKANRK